METTMLVGERFFADKLSPIFFPPKHGDIIAFNDPRYNYSSNYFINWWQMKVYGPQNITKRVIACPGDEIKGVIEDDKPVIYLKKSNDKEFKKLNEPYLNKNPIIAVCPKDSSQGRPFEYRSYDPKNALNNQQFYNFTNNEINSGMKIAALYGQPQILIPQTAMPYDNFHVTLDNDHYWVMGDNRLGSGDSRTAFGPLHKKFIHGKIKFRIWSLDSNRSWWLLDLIKHPINFVKQIRWDRCCQFSA